MSGTQRTAIVTAAGGAIGGAAVEHLLRQEMRVIAADRDAATLDDLARRVASPELYAVVADLTKQADVERVCATAARLGGLHVLVNGVGSTCSGGLRDLDLDRWHTMFELNLTSVFRCTRAALPLLENTRGDRVVINLSSTLATVADPTTLAYGAFKAALEHWTRSLALELAPHGIRSLAVAPGPVAASGGEAAFESPTFTRLNPLGRFASADEIGGVIAYLASPAAAYITGTIIKVDGGDSALGAGWGPLTQLLGAES